MRPLGELRLDGGGDGLQIGEIDVVNAKLTGEFPDALDRVEVRAVRGQRLSSANWPSCA